MGNHVDDALDELVSELLGCGAVLSQMISRMVQWESAGRSAPDAAPIPTVAHELLSSVLGKVKRRHSRRDLRVAAAIVREATEAITEEIFFVALPDEDSNDADDHTDDQHGAEDPPDDGHDPDFRLVDGD